jgi:hypothetical protein
VRQRSCRTRPLAAARGSECCDSEPYSLVGGPRSSAACHTGANYAVSSGCSEFRGFRWLPTEGAGEEETSAAAATLERRRVPVRVGVEGCCPNPRVLDRGSSRTTHCRALSPAARPCRVGTPGCPGAPLTEPDLWASHPALRDDGVGDGRVLHETSWLAKPGAGPLPSSACASAHLPCRTGGGKPMSQMRSWLPRQ